MMHERQFSQHEMVQGFGYGFFERLEQGQRYLEHGGNSYGTNSHFMLNKEQNIGVFISNNSSSGALVSYQFASDFIAHFYPSAQQTAQLEQQSGLNGESELDRYVGTYYTNRYNQDDFTKLNLALSTGVQVKRTGEQQLQVSYLEEERIFDPVAPLVFLDPERNQYIAFEADQNGKITHLFYLDSFVYEKGKWYVSPLLHAAVLALLVLLALAVSFTAAIRLIRSRFGKMKEIRSVSRGRWLTLTARFQLLISITFLCSRSPSSSF